MSESEELPESMQSPLANSVKYPMPIIFKILLKSELFKPVFSNIPVMADITLTKESMQKIKITQPPARLIKIAMSGLIGFTTT